jgi:MFS family permease
MVAGVTGCTIAGLCYLAATALAARAHASLAALLVGRVILGFGDSFIVTGALSWGIARLGAQHAGRVMTWHGIAMYGAVAAGAPLGLLLYRWHGFTAVAWLVVLAPLISIAVAAAMTRAAVHPGKRLPFFAVLGMVWKPGLGLALGSVGFAAVTTFATLLFVTRGWAGTTFALSVFTCAYVLPRSLYSGLVDRLGGASVAAVSLAAEALGQLLIWVAPGPVLAFAGLALAGLGCSMMYPGLGVVAIRPAPPQSRGAALGAYGSFFNLSMALSGPLLGAVAARFSFAAIFLCAGAAALGAAVLAWQLGRAQQLAAMRAQ